MLNLEIQGWDDIPTVILQHILKVSSHLELFKLTFKYPSYLFNMMWISLQFPHCLLCRNRPIPLVENPQLEIINFLRKNLDILIRIFYGYYCHVIVNRTRHPILNYYTTKISCF